MEKRELNELSGLVGVRLYHILLRYPIFSEDGQDKVYEIDDGRVQVIVRNPITSLRQFKAFLYCVWKGRLVEEVPVLDAVRIYVDRDMVKALLSKDLSLGQFLELLRGVENVKYEIYEVMPNRKRRIEWFRLFYKLEGEEELNGHWYLKVLIDRNFYSLCKEKGLFVYLILTKDLKSPYAFNLFGFLSANSNVRFTEKTLIERAGIPENMEGFTKRRYLARALDNLVEHGFLKGWRREGEYYVLERVPIEELRILATKKAKELEEKAEEFIKRLSEKKKERVRKQRQRKKQGKQEDLGF